MKYDLSILIPARNEEYLKNTVDDIVKNKRGKTEILVGLDGAWADPPLSSHQDLTILYVNKSIGQRAMTNQLCRLSEAKYVMKVDAHCSFDEGFDVKLLADMNDNWTVAPLMRNLHVFNWVCPQGHKRYQSPSGNCKICGKPVKKDIVWFPKESPKSCAYRFDKTMHFQYWNDYKRRQVGDLVESFSLQGSCFMLTRQKFWELDICEEAFGSWGQQGTEVACKTWLSGGEVRINKKTWYAHCFRTQGGDFGFPYELSGSAVDHARRYCRDLFMNNKYKKAIHTFDWLIDKFKPIPDWHDVKLKDASRKGIVFFTDNRLNLKIAHAVQSHLKNTKLPIVSSSLKPMVNFGTNIYLPLERGYLTMFKQILAALEKSTAEIVYLCEHDVIYHPSHFDFTPPKKDIFYYNVHWWKVSSDGTRAVSWEASQVSGLVAYRETLLNHYRKRVAIVEKYGYNHSMGFEPGAHNYKGEVEKRDSTKIAPDVYIDDIYSEEFKSKYPYIDIRTGGNLSKSKWTLDDFRDKNTAKNFKIGKLTDIPGWDFSEGLTRPFALI
jgi:hypothetical protein